MKILFIVTDKLTHAKWIVVYTWTKENEHWRPSLFLNKATDGQGTAVKRFKPVKAILLQNYIKEKVYDWIKAYDEGEVSKHPGCL